MSSEVLLMNRTGVALAADSAATVGGIRQKVLTTADKMFALGDHPMAAMVYGSSDLLSIPWETVLSEYVQWLPKQPRRSVADYAADLVRFVAGKSKLFDEVSQCQFISAVSTDVFTCLRESLKQQVEEASTAGSLTRSRLDSVLRDVTGGWLSAMREYRPLDTLPPRFKSKVRERYESEIEQAATDVLGSFPRGPRSREQLIELVSEVVVRDTDFGPSAGVVITGYGAKDVFPGYAQITFRGVAANWALITIEGSEQVSRDNPVVVQGFAQDDVIETFTSGLAPDLRELVHGGTEIVLERVLAHISERIVSKSAPLSQDQVAYMKGALEAGLDEYGQYLAAVTQQRHTLPLVATVASLSLVDLARVADGLLQMTILHRRLRPGPAEVDGAVDVIAISKRDGLKWVRRKSLTLAQ